MVSDSKAVCFIVNTSNQLGEVIINSIAKPLLKVFALPLAILTLGLSTLILNIAMVWLTIYLLPVR